VSRYGELKARLKQWVLRRRRKVCGEEQARMPAGSEFHSEGLTTTHVQSLDVGITLIVFDARSPRNPGECPKIPYISRN